MKRITIAQMLGGAGVVAVGLAALRAGTEPWFKAVYSLTLVLLMLTLLGAIVRPRDRRAGWVGFALFGWTVFIAISVPIIRETVAHSILGSDLIAEAILAIHRAPAKPAGLPEENSPKYQNALAAYSWIKKFAYICMNYNSDFDSYFVMVEARSSRVHHAEQTAWLLLCPIAGLVGAVLGRILGPREGPVATMGPGG